MIHVLQKDYVNDDTALYTNCRYEGRNFKSQMIACCLNRLNIKYYDINMIFTKQRSFVNTDLICFNHRRINVVDCYGAKTPTPKEKVD